MVKHNNKKLVVVISLLIPFFSLNGIGDSVAKVATVLVGALSVGGTYKVWHSVPAVQSLHPLFLVSSSAITTIFAYYFFNSITPTGRIKRANIILNKILSCKLARVTFDDEKDFLDAVYNKFMKEDLPLVSAYHYFVNLLLDLDKAFLLINKTAKDMGTNKSLHRKYDASLICAKKLYKNIGKALRSIREHKDYLPQLAIYKEFLMSTKQTVAQEQMAHAQTQMAHAQQGFVVLKWIKWLLRMS